ncbi:hypothetical protein AXG93_1593s1100 [Marchantia polymorpha subsp. ruderalis]|uniref:Uncharacterized protein n=1 Tax=Marchantia polymorpha subsp. ruderalis TaxID=1480154 RepID=A0A176WNG6_MARPO|nr:hypothetical protein AXG93_1593s1100 [Marchantia polymorpha subsp. ruderalis]
MLGEGERERVKVPKKSTANLIAEAARLLACLLSVDSCRGHLGGESALIWDVWSEHQGSGGSGSAAEACGNCGGQRRRTRCGGANDELRASSTMMGSYQILLGAVESLATDKTAYVRLSLVPAGDLQAKTISLGVCVFEFRAVLVGLSSLVPWTGTDSSDADAEAGAGAGAGAGTGAAAAAAARNRELLLGCALSR